MEDTEKGLCARDVVFYHLRSSVQPPKARDSPDDAVLARSHRVCREPRRSNVSDGDECGDEHALGRHREGRGEGEAWGGISKGGDGPGKSVCADRLDPMDMITGGTDSTSNTIEFAMAEIVNKPEVMRRAQQELDTLLGSTNAPLEESQILHLPYLQAIMKETLRLHPVLPLMIPHSPSESCIVGGYTIPKGSRVFVNVWTIHRELGTLHSRRTLWSSNPRGF